MSERSRITLMRSLWFISALTLGAILIGAIGLGGATTWLITLSVAVLSLALRSGQGVTAHTLLTVW